MMIRGYRFNFYLVVAVVAAAVWLQPVPAKAKKPESTLRIHVETARDASDRTVTASLPRSKPIVINIERTPFLTEANVSKASVVDAMGGFAIQIEFDRRGSWILEQYSVSNKGRRFAIFVTFIKPEEKEKDKKAKAEPAEGRWLAAPLIGQKISDGILLFTPDATREEANQIVAGINNVAKTFQSK